MKLAEVIRRAIADLPPGERVPLRYFLDICKLHGHTNRKRIKNVIWEEGLKPGIIQNANAGAFDAPVRYQKVNR